MSLRLPLIVLVLAFTAIPMQVRPVTWPVLAVMVEPRVETADVLQNVAGYVPIGIVLASTGNLTGLALAGVISLFAETAQLFSLGRLPSLIDVATNVTGAALGIVIASRWRRRWLLRPPRVDVTRRIAWAAAVLAAAYLALAPIVTPRMVQETIRNLFTDTDPEFAVNVRGATAPGRLEAWWKFDTVVAGSIPDSSGDGANGALVNGPRLVEGVDGLALSLTGGNEYVDFGRFTSLLMTGSMTISAWVNSGVFPADDAPIVSSHGRNGYQLDITVDRGPRTIGFKLTNTSGRLMARYGKTPLDPGRWYHVAGVYDAGARTLNVFLNGRPDNDCVRGPITDRQRPALMNLLVGRHARQRQRRFIGLIDEVRIYSRPLTREEIETDMLAAQQARSMLPHDSPPAAASTSDSAENICVSLEPADARTPGATVAFGILVAVACAGLFPGSRLRTVAVSLAAGGALLAVLASTMTGYEAWMTPALTLLGGICVAVSMNDR